MADGEDTIVVKGHIRKPKGTHEELFEGIPSRDEVIPLSEEQKTCPDCGAEMEIVGKGFVRKEFRGIRRCMDNVPEICRLPAAVQAGAGWEADGRRFE